MDLFAPAGLSGMADQGSVCSSAAQSPELCCVFWVPWANVADPSCALTAPGPAIGVDPSGASCAHKISNYGLLSSQLWMASRIASPLLQQCNCSNQQKQISRLVLQSGAQLSGSGCWVMMLLCSSPARHNACHLRPATLGTSYALNDMTSSSMTCTLIHTVLRDQSAWGKCGEPFMRGYCAQACGRCTSGCSDVPPPGRFFCAQQVSRHCEPAALYMWCIIN